MGDSNAHVKLWDPKSKTDSQGVNIPEDLLDAEARVMNTKEATRMDSRR